MSMRYLNRTIRVSAQAFFCNKKLRDKDILEWSSGTITPEDDEVVAWLADPGVNVAIKKKTNDKRTSFASAKNSDV